MNKCISILIFLCLTITANLSAQLKQDPKTFRYYSIPATREINKNEYHQLAWTCKDILKNYIQQKEALFAQYGSGTRLGDNHEGKAAVTQYLQRIATKTSIRLLEDLQAEDFNI